MIHNLYMTFGFLFYLIHTLNFKPPCKEDPCNLLYMYMFMLIKTRLLSTCVTAEITATICGEISEFLFKIYDILARLCLSSKSKFLFNVNITDCKCQLDSIQSQTDSRPVPSCCCFVTVSMHRSHIEDSSWLQVVADLVPICWGNRFKVNKTASSWHIVAIVLAAPQPPNTVYPFVTAILSAAYCLPSIKC